MPTLSRPVWCARCALYASLLALGVVLGPRGSVANPHADSVSIYLINHGYHVGLAMPTSAVSSDVWPEAATFPEARYLEVGWGDARFYQTLAPGLGMTLRAGLWPTPSVVHVAGLRQAPPLTFQGQDVVAVRISAARLRKLVRFVSEEVTRSGAEAALPTGEGLYGDSSFFAARRSYHAFYNCNHWAAEALRVAGLPLDRRGATTAGSLMRRVRAALGLPAPRPSS
ncbi:MAG: DUF2459 domain-containing protein [Bacteroidota bacterium]